MTDWIGHLSGPPAAWAPQLTLVGLLFVRPWKQYPPTDGAARGLGSMYGTAVVAGLLLEPLTHSAIYWSSLCLVHFAWVFVAYHVADNHRYLEGYWCLVIALALASGRDVDETLTAGAASLVGACFALAVAWKVLACSFRSGSFFVYGFLHDDRFLPIAVWIGGLTDAVTRSHRRARRQAWLGARVSAAPVPERLVRVAKALTLWTIAIEVLVALVFAQHGAVADVWKVGAVALFCVTTYILVPVPDFGHILIVLTMVSITDGRLRALLLAVNAVIALAPQLMRAIYVVTRRIMVRHAEIDRALERAS